MQMLRLLHVHRLELPQAAGTDGCDQNHLDTVLISLASPGDAAVRLLSTLPITVQKLVLPRLAHVHSVQWRFLLQALCPLTASLLLQAWEQSSQAEHNRMPSLNATESLIAMESPSTNFTQGLAVATTSYQLRDPAAVELATAGEKSMSQFYDAIFGVFEEEDQVFLQRMLIGNAYVSTDRCSLFSVLIILFRAQVNGRSFGKSLSRM